MTRGGSLKGSPSSPACLSACLTGGDSPCCSTSFGTRSHPALRIPQNSSPASEQVHPASTRAPSSCRAWRGVGGWGWVARRACVGACGLCVEASDPARACVPE